MYLYLGMTKHCFSYRMQQWINNELLLLLLLLCVCVCVWVGGGGIIRRACQPEIHYWDLCLCHMLKSNHYHSFEDRAFPHGLSHVVQMCCRYLTTWQVAGQQPWQWLSDDMQNWGQTPTIISYCIICFGKGKRQRYLACAQSKKKYHMILATVRAFPLTLAISHNMV